MKHIEGPERGLVNILVFVLIWKVSSKELGDINHTPRSMGDRVKIQIIVH
jgi:hypothetical protein